MKCPFCGYHDTRVLDTRSSEEGDRIRRRRECGGCQKRFTTYEVIETTPLIVVKKDGSREAFSTDKLLSSLLKSCEKRQIPLSRLEQATNEIEIALRNSLNGEISTTEIGNLAMDKLKDIDEAAYVRFASVYRKFKDINSFMEELTKLVNSKE